MRSLPIYSAGLRFLQRLGYSLLQATLFGAILGLLVFYRVPRALLTEDASFLESGIIDSTGFLELVTFVERTYAITIADHELGPENMHSLRRVCEFITRKRDVLGLTA